MLYTSLSPGMFAHLFLTFILVVSVFLCAAAARCIAVQGVECHDGTPFGGPADHYPGITPTRKQ